MVESKIMNNESLDVAVLLSTYNGERYIREQLDSILNQTYTNVIVYIRDDGSTDGTVATLREYQGDRVVLVEDNLGNVKPAKSFLHLLSRIKSDVYMFCDQDDVWLPDKIKNAVSAIIEIGANRPILYHSDLKVVNSDLSFVADSFHQREGVRMPQAQRFKVLLVQNCVVGCTMAITDELVKVSRVRCESPEEVAMHDWWFALVASAFGKIIYSPRREVLYRQHGKNVSGISNKSFVRKIMLQFSYAGIRKIENYKYKISQQARTFKKIFYKNLSGDQLAITDAVIQSGEKGGEGMRGVIRCFRLGAAHQNLYMNAAIVFTTSVASIFYVFQHKTPRKDH